MNILSEEAAEVIQAISKCHRFGLDNVKPGLSLTNKQHLEEEIGDLVAMIELLKLEGVITDYGIKLAMQRKFEKLMKWSTIYERD